MRNMTDPVAATGEQATEGSSDQQSSADTKRALRRKTVRFVVVFVTSVLVLLSSYELASDSHANDWYLLQVARTTSWLLSHIGYSCQLGSADRLRGKEHQVRQAIEAWKRGERAPKSVPSSKEPAPPLTAWEAWQYKAGTMRQVLAEAEDELARLQQDTTRPAQERAEMIAEAEQNIAQMKNRETGPLVVFVLKPGPARLLSDAQKELADLRQDASLSAVVRARRVADKAAEIARLKKDAEASRQPAAGNPPKRAERKFSFVVIPDCGAIPSMTIFFSAILAFPARWWKRLLGIVIGIPMLYGVNAFRLAFLAVIGAWDGGGQWFRFSHEYVWQGIYIVFVVALWMVWVEFLVRRRT